MSDYRILTDSTTDLTPELIREIEVDMIPMFFTIDGQTYVNNPEANELSFHDFYDKLRAGSQSTTSQITPERFREVVEPMLQQGTDVLYLAFSSGLSGTYNNACIMFDELSEKYPERKLIAVDTLGASMGEGLLVYLASQQKKQGKNIDEVAQWMRDNRLNMAHWVVADDLNHLKRGGRVTGATAFVGTMLGIKPIIHMDDEGKLIPVEKVRGRRNGVNKLLEHMEKTGVDIKNQTIFISHGDCEEDARYVAAQVKEKFGTKKIYINYIGPVIGSHSGPGTLALFYLAQNRD